MRTDEQVLRIQELIPAMGIPLFEINTRLGDVSMLLAIAGILYRVIDREKGIVVIPYILGGLALLAGRICAVSTID